MICADSGCIIDFLKGKREAAETISKYESQVITTELNAFEIYFGIYQGNAINAGEEKAADELFSSMNVLPFDSGCGKISSKIMAELMKEGKMINQNDALIAGVLRKNEINSIITRNEKHFSRIKGLKVISY